MKPLGLAVVFVGYTLAYFGWCSVRGPGVGLVDLVVPGRPVTIPTSSSSSSSGPIDTNLLNLDAMNRLTPAQRRSLPKRVRDWMNQVEPGYTKG